MKSHTKELRELFWPSVAFARTILGSLCIHWGMLMVVGLKLENVSIPSSGYLGGSVTLGCDYLLESDALLSLKFYKDGHEFFRYHPGNRDSPISTFTLPGVHVDLGESLKVRQNYVRFRLKNLDLNSGGTYRCEISAESPTFQTLQNEGNLSIMALPESPKTLLSGFSSVVQYGDRINGNCTFAESFPPAMLTIYLNDVKINKSDEVELIPYEPIKVGQRQTSVSGVKFRAAPKHFQLGILQIKCEAKVLDQKWEARRNISLQNYQSPFQTAGQNRYSAGNSCSMFSIEMSRWILIKITLGAVFNYY